jgi:hypothetical protein
VPVRAIKIESFFDFSRDQIEAAVIETMLWSNTFFSGDSLSAAPGDNSTRLRQPVLAGGAARGRM